jgi:hypothetical protein
VGYVNLGVRALRSATIYSGRVPSSGVTRARVVLTGCGYAAAAASAGVVLLGRVAWPTARLVAVMSSAPM